MKNFKITFILILFSISCLAQRQSKKPISWTLDTTALYEVGDTIKIKFQGKMLEGWYIYSSDSDSTEFVKPAKLNLLNNNSFSKIGNLRAINSIQKFDKDLEVNVQIHEGTALLEQKIIVRSKPIKIHANLEYMLIKTEAKEGIIIPMTEKFETKL